MSAILCRWLNQEFRLSKTADPRTFAVDFSSGYLIGEILHKHNLQDDFSMFSNTGTAISKVSNFTRLKPTLKLLGICLDKNATQDLMQEKPGVAMHLLYQLYVSLEKKNPNIRRRIKPTAKAKLLIEEHGLPQVVKFDVYQKLQKNSQHNGYKCHPQDAMSVRQLEVQDKKLIKKVSHEKHNNMTGCHNLAAQSQITKPPFLILPRNTKRQKQHKERQAQEVIAEIAKFETSGKKLGVPGFGSSLSSSGRPHPVDIPPGGTKQGCTISGSRIQLPLQSNNNYIQEIRQRLRENAVACAQREKRKDRFLVEQLEANKAQQEAQQEEQLVERLTCKTKQEEHLAAQLMQTRRQKEVILEDRLVREQQYQDQRQKDFQKALYGDALKQDE